MPPPRRRRPVQPATRVRLPRTARPRTAPAIETAVAEEASADTGEAVKTELRTDELHTDDLHTDDLHTDEPAAADELRTGEAATQERPETEPAGKLRTGELPADTATSATATDETATSATATDVTTADDTATSETATDDTTTSDTTTDETATDGQLPEGAAAESADREAATAERATTAVRRHAMLLPVCLGALAVILGGLAVWFGLEASSATSGVDTSNVALTNPAATRQVSQQIATAVNTIFSYNYADTAKTSQAAATLLTGKAKGEYNTLFKLVRQDAPQEKLVLTTTVTNAGVESLVGNRARLLVFADQRDVAGSAHNTTEAGAMFAVNAVNQGGRWKITGIDTFGGGG